MDTATRPRWTLARWVLVVALILPAVYITAATGGFVWFGFGPTPFFLVPMLVIGVVAVFWPNKWLLLAGGILAFLEAVAEMGGYLSGQGDPGVLRPDRTLEFSYWWLVTLLGVSALVAAIANLRRSRAGAAAPPAGTTAWGVGAVCVAVALFAGGLAVAGMEHKFVPAESGVGVGLTADVSDALAARNDKWAPNAVEVGVGKVLHLNVTNGDAGVHVFNQDDHGVRLDLAPATTHDVWLRFDQAGTYQWYCEIHSTKGADGKWTGMTGTITVS